MIETAANEDGKPIKRLAEIDRSGGDEDPGDGEGIRSWVHCQHVEEATQFGGVESGRDPQGPLWSPAQENSASVEPGSNSIGMNAGVCDGAGARAEGCTAMQALALPIRLRHGGRVA